MTKINLKDIYPFYHNDCFIIVDDCIAETFKASNCQEQTYQRKRYRYKAHYSLDCYDNIEKDITFMSITPEAHYEKKLTHSALYQALTKLPDVQAQRIFAYFFLEMSQSEIAQAEGVSKMAVSRSIQKALGTLEHYLKKII